MERQKLQGIFYTQSPEGEWLYTVRADVADTADAARMTRELARRFKRPANVRIEDWNWPKSEADGFAYQCTAEGKDAAR